MSAQSSANAQGLDKPTTGGSILSSTGAVGKQFEADGSIGQVGEKVGGPFGKDGVIGKNFTSSGAVGGTIDKAVGGPAK